MGSEWPTKAPVGRVFGVSEGLGAYGAGSEPATPAAGHGVSGGWEVYGRAQSLQRQREASILRAWLQLNVRKTSPVTSGRAVAVAR